MDNIALIFISALTSGLLATLVTLLCQKRTASDNQKMKVFETLMVHRVPGMLHFEANVNALNSIDVIFYKDSSVREAYKNFLDEAEKPKEMNPNLQDKHLRLLEEMAKSLGLKKLSWEDIKHPYFPVGLGDRLRDDEMVRKTSIMNNMESAKLAQGLNNRQILNEQKEL